MRSGKSSTVQFVIHKHYSSFIQSEPPTFPTKMSSRIIPSVHKEPKSQHPNIAKVPHTPGTYITHNSRLLYYTYRHDIATEQIVRFQTPSYNPKNKLNPEAANHDKKTSQIRRLIDCFGEDLRVLKSGRYVDDWYIFPPY